MTLQKFRIVDDSSAFVRSSQCNVTEKHIKEMYDRFDSGLCDQSTCNAVALALRELTGAKIRVFRRGGSTMFERFGDVHALPKSVHDWLSDADRGISAKPFCFEIALPVR